MQSLERMTKLWPKLDGAHQDGLRDFFGRWTHSWVNFSGTMSRQDKDKLLASLDEELTRRVDALEDLYQDAESSPSAPPMPELPMTKATSRT